VPGPAPFVTGPDGSAVVYLDARERRLTYQDARGFHPLTGPLGDDALPAVRFADPGAYLALVKDCARIVDTRTWRERTVPSALDVPDLNARGDLVVTTASKVLVLDRSGRTRMSLPQRRIPANEYQDDYHLRPDGRRLVVIRGGEEKVETYDTGTGRRLNTVTPAFPGLDRLGTGLSWSEEGSFLVYDSTGNYVYNLDLSTGKVWTAD
jgi:hypothetical protein